jgi:predicted DNA-binding transcriptional regulator YafY
MAYVPEYGQMRTFAVERIEDVSLLEDRFTPREDLPDEAFPHSLGVHTGDPVQVEVRFAADVAGYVRARQWHASQALRDEADGAVVMTLQVCADRALQSWILSFGAAARVLAPAELARDIAKQIEQARAQYQPV